MKAESNCPLIPLFVIFILLVSVFVPNTGEL